MKRIVSVFVLLFSFTFVFGQDSTTTVHNPQRGADYFKKKVGQLANVDGYRVVVVGGDTLIRVRGIGTLTANELKIYSNGSNMASAINTAAGLDFVKTIRFSSDSSRPFTINSAVNFKGKTVIFENGSYLTGTGSIDSLIIDADDYVKAFDTTLTITNLRSTNGYITLQNIGAPANGVDNDYRYFQNLADISSNNKVFGFIPSGRYVMKGVVNLSSNAKLVGGREIVINGDKSSGFNSKAADNIILSSLNFELQNTGSGSINFIDLGDTSQATSNNILIENNRIMNRRATSTTIVLKNINNVKVIGNVIDSSGNKGIEFRSVTKAEARYNQVTNSGRSGITIHSHNWNVRITDNNIKGTAQSLDLNDGAIDIYGGNNHNVWIERNYIETGEQTYNSIQNHIPVRIQGVQNLQLNNNTIISTSPYLLYAIRFSSRDSLFTNYIQASGNFIHLKAGSYYNRIVSIQDVPNVTFTNYKLVIDSATTSYSSPVMFSISNSPAMDTASNYTFTNGEVWANNKPFRLIGQLAPVRSIDLSGTKIYDVIQDWYLLSGSEIQNVRWISGIIKTTTVFNVNNLIRNIYVTGINYLRSGNQNMWAVSGDYNGVAIVEKNFINGRRAKEIAGGRWDGISIINDANFTVPDSASIVYTTRSTTQTATLPDSSVWKGRTIRIVSLNTSGAYTLVKYHSGDTASVGESLLYNSDGTAWRRINKPAGFVSGGGGGSYDDSWIYDSLTVHSNRITALEGNDTLNYNFYRGVGGSKSDSLYVEFQDTTFQAYAPVGGGGAVSSVFGRTGAVTAQSGDYDITQISNALDSIKSAFYGRNVRILAGVVRATVSGSDVTWNYISDSEHDKIGFTTVTSYTNGLIIKYPHVKKILSFTITPDETFAKNGITCGASVGMDSATIKIYKPYVSGGFLMGNGSTYTKNHFIGWDLTYSSGLLEYSPYVLGGTTVSQNDETTQAVYVGKNGYHMERKILGLTKKIGFNVVDQFGNIVTDAPTSDDIIQITGGVIDKVTVNPRTASGNGSEAAIFNSSSNFWIIAVLEY